MRFEIKVLFLTISRAIAYYTYAPLVSTDAKFVMYGDIANLDDLLSTSLNYSQEFGDDNDLDEEIVDEDAETRRKMTFENELKTLNLLNDIDKGKNQLPDAKDYIDITKSIDFRRVMHYYKKAGWGGWFLSWLGLFGNMGVWDDSDGKDIEEEKLDMLENCGLQFLMHARFKIQEAITKKSPFRGDKRYMLGYLFNRVRRVLYDQKKVVYIAMMTNKYKMRRKLRALLRLYQQVARYDVDLVDLTRYIRRVYFKPANFDRYDESHTFNLALGRRPGRQSRGQPFPPSPGQPVGPSPGQPGGPSPGQPVGPSPGQPVGPSPGQPVGPSPGQPVGLSPGQPVGPSPGQQVGPSPGQPVAPPPGLPVAPPPGLPVGS